MKPNEVKNTGKKQVFQSKFWNALTRTHISVPLAMFYSFSIWMLYTGIIDKGGEVVYLVSLFFVGLLFFSLFEYMIHRFAFHMEDDDGIKTWIKYHFHGVHHEFPKDMGRLAMPPLVSATLATILYFVFTSTMGVYAYGFLPGFLTGYATYLWIHFAVHVYRPPNNFLKSLWVLHGIHHYKDDHVAYGVSSHFWDILFGTMPKK